MSELTFTALRFGYLVLLWVFVALAIGVLRRDLSNRARSRAHTARGMKTDKAGAAGTLPTHLPAHPSAATAPAHPQGHDVYGQGWHPGYQPAAEPRYLTATAGSLSGTRFPLGDSSIVIGRALGCTVVLDDDYSSNRHARVLKSGGQWFLEDLNSTNGTIMGDTPVTGIVPLQVGSTIRIGRTILEVHGASPAAQVPA